MEPKRKTNETAGSLFDYITLGDMCDSNHPFFKMAGSVDWERSEEECRPLFSGKIGCPAKPTRLLLSLHYLKYKYNLSDEETVERWMENPYWQYFSGETLFQTKRPINPSSMTRWRKRVGEELLKLLLAEIQQYDEKIDNNRKQKKSKTDRA